GLYSDPKYSVTYPNGDEVQTFTIAFLVEEWRGTLRVDDDEVTALGFFPLDALPSPIYSIHAETIEDLRGYDGAFIVKGRSARAHSPYGTLVMATFAARCWLDRRRARRGTFACC